MTQALATTNNHLPAVPTFTFTDVEKIANAIARGGMFGTKDPYAVLTLCMLAQAEGQHPAVVFRDYDIIQGKPAKKAEAMLRDFINGGGKVTWNQLSDSAANATFSHPQGGTVTIDWTMDRAIKAGLGGKDMWKKFPRQMLRSRTVSEGIRTVFPGASSGMYVTDEVVDMGYVETPTGDLTASKGNNTPLAPPARRGRPPKITATIDIAQEQPPHDAETGEIIETAPVEGVKPKQTADEWTNDYLGRVHDCETVEQLMELQETSSKALVKLLADRPELYELTVNAGTKRAQEFQQAAYA